jgi:phthiodiolone/phenolphthiodiolone dimycocerosates ketoreductase
MQELIFSGTPDEVIDQFAEWRDHGLRYPLILNASPLNPRLRKTLAANAPFLKILRGLKKL